MQDIAPVTKELPTDSNRIIKLEKQVELLQADMRALRKIAHRGEDE